MTTGSLAILVAALLVIASAVGWVAGRHQRPGGDPAALPLASALESVRAQLQLAERDRAAGQAALTTELSLLRGSSEQVRREAAALASALRSPQARGRWGETQLRRVLELGGALEHCDFTQQETVRSGDGPDGRPDVVIRLAGGGQLAVDAKVPLTAYLACAQAADDTERASLRQQHAVAVRAHVRSLSARRYATLLDHSPDFVVLFLPGDVFLDAALQADPALQEFAFGLDVVLATPGSLLALIRTVAFTWRQEQLVDNAREVSRLGKELHERLGTSARHLAKVGTSLRSSVEAYNATLGSLESRVLPSARRLSKLVADGKTVHLAPLSALPRSPIAPELTDEPVLSAEPQLTAEREPTGEPELAEPWSA